MYIPEGTSNVNLAEDASKVFALARRNRVDIFHLGLVEENYDCSEQLDTESIQHGHLVIDEQESNVLAASFSPDGSAVAFSTNDGEVLFYKINFKTAGEGDDEGNNEGEEDGENNVTPKVGEKDGESVHVRPKCLQRWTPHEGKPVTSLYFLDDIKVSC